MIRTARLSVGMERLDSFPVRKERLTAMQTPTDAQLLAYIDEQLDGAVAAQVERALRESEALRARAAQLIHERDQGGATVGEIWRRHRLSCPTREQLGSYLLGIAEEFQARYIDFHLRTIGCRYCQANLDDLQTAQRDGQAVESRRRRFFESSRGVWQNLPEG